MGFYWCVYLRVKGSQLGVRGSGEGEIIHIEKGALPESMYLSDWPNIIRIYNLDILSPTYNCTIERNNINTCILMAIYSVEQLDVWLSGGRGGGVDIEDIRPLFWPRFVSIFTHQNRRCIVSPFENSWIRP